MKNGLKKSYPPRLECDYLAPVPSGKGYICGALTELLCATRGTCKFFRPRKEKEGN